MFKCTTFSIKAEIITFSIRRLNFVSQVTERQSTYSLCLEQLQFRVSDCEPAKILNHLSGPGP